MTKITIEFQDENSTEFAVDASSIGYRELLVLARQLHKCDIVSDLSDDNPAIEIELCEFGAIVRTTKSILDWRLHLVADEFYLAAQHQFFAVQNQAMAQAAMKRQANQIAIAKLQQGGRGNTGFIRGVGQG